MKIEYDKAYLHELYEDGTCKNKKYKFQPQIVKKYQKRIDTFMAASRMEDLFVFRSLNMEALHGDREGLFSVRIDKQYRMEFSLRNGGAEGEDVSITIARIIELSNHYN